MKNNLVACWKHFSEQKTLKTVYEFSLQVGCFPLVQFVSFQLLLHASAYSRARGGVCRRTTLLTLQLSSRNQLTTMSKVGSVTARGRISHFQLFAVPYNWCILKCLLNRNTSFWAQYSQIFEPTVCVQQKIRVWSLRLSVLSCNRRVWKLFG